MFVQKKNIENVSKEKKYSELLTHVIHCDGGLITFNISLFLECNESFPQLLFNLIIF